MFKEAKELLHADEWLNTIEQKFHLLRVTKMMKAEYALHQLQGLQVSVGLIICLPYLLEQMLLGSNSR